MEEIFNLIGYASGLAGAELGTANGPFILKQSPLAKAFPQINWTKILTTEAVKGIDEFILINEIATDLARVVATLLKEKKQLCVVGGDHTSALGTWSGVYDAYHQKGDIGLIWVDAHMDSHTPETSETKNIHGMPLAGLLGYGPAALTCVLHPEPKLKPENLCLIGVRSFEPGEAALLKKLNVKIYFMDEVQEKGFVTVFKEAIAQVSKQTVGYGLSLDIDGIDPIEAPAVDVPEANGIAAAEIEEGLKILIQDPHFITSEIVEFDPYHDIDQKTERLIYQFLSILSQQRRAKSSPL